MSKPFDVTTKQLVESQPEAWVRYVGLPEGEVELIDADLATVSTEADRILRVNSANPYLAHIEFQVRYKRDLPQRTLRYNVLVYYRHELPVQSIVILLRREADGPAMTGSVGYATAEDDSLAFRYRVLRVWEQSPDALLAGDLAILPLAMLTDKAAERLPEIVRRMESRIQQEATPSQAEMLWMSTYLLLGLRYPEAFASELLKGVQALEESTTYQAIIAKGEAKGRAEGRAEGEARGRAEGETLGRAEEARNLVLRLGRKRLGEPAPNTIAALQNLTDIERLEQLAERLLEVETWAELLP